MNKNYKLDKWLLIRYIKDNYKKKYEEEISLAKLNKTLYFLYGYWVIENCIKNENINKSNIQLFEPNFIADKYGPVDEDILNGENPAIYYNGNWTKEIEAFIDSHLNKLFPMSNYSLVCIAQSHSCWKNVYNEETKATISEDSIVKEFESIINK